MLSFDDVFFLTPVGGIYGNNNVVLCKLGRLLIVFEHIKGITCYVLNSSDIPINPYVAQKLKEECLGGIKMCKIAFGIPDSSLLTDEGDIEFQYNVDGSCSIRFKREPVKLQNGVEFYNALVKEVRDDMGFCTFRDLVKIKNTSPNRTKVFIHNGNGVMNLEQFDVVVNITSAGCLLDSIPYYWDVYYDASLECIEFNPVLSRLPNLRPLFK